MDTQSNSSKAISFRAHRSRLYGIAYRMLGTRADAEDVVQDAYLRWHEVDESRLDSGEAWLVTVITRLCIDRLRSAKLERETYAGPWLPEPLVLPDPATPEWAAELASDVSMAFLTVLERLAPEERAAFLLHQVFDFDYDEIARMLDKTQAACRQMVHRARERVRQEKPRFQVSRDAHVKLLERFMAASRSGALDELRALFAEDAILIGDAGGKVASVNRILHGGDRIARLYHVVARRLPVVSFAFTQINGELGLLRYINGKLDGTISIESDGRRILAMYTVRNPDKLVAIADVAGKLSQNSI
jgi:RNA polymerase sigma-70 factor (ECF subfamily)